jgi:hypothetical protein
MELTSDTPFENQFLILKRGAQNGKRNEEGMRGNEEGRGNECIMIRMSFHANLLTVVMTS